MPKINKKSITVVISSRNNCDSLEEFLMNLSSNAGCAVKIMYFVNQNAMSLSSVYSSVLGNKNIETEVIVFIHDDIEFLKPGWGAEVLRLFNENKDYGIIGVAGSAQFDDKGAWWLYKKKYGQVLHKHDGKAWLSTFSPLLDKDLQEVCVIDGLFIAVNRLRVAKDFDSSIPGFNFYDIDFCLANYITHKTKIGVTTNIRLAHKSIGELSSEWYNNLNIINDKYRKYFPIDVEKDNKRTNEIEDGKD